MIKICIICQELFDDKTRNTNGRAKTCSLKCQKINFINNQKKHNKDPRRKKLHNERTTKFQKTEIGRIRMRLYNKKAYQKRCAEKQASLMLQSIMIGGLK